MANLLVRDVDEALVRSLKQRAGRHGRSAEAEHRAILAAALGRTRRRSFAQVLASMPDVGRNEDFARLESRGKAPRVFG
ncbi:MAG: DNA-binding protein [Betaproteobacteria bacterium]|nr:DNA-binding protein [Betaproteobacteria bacterium]